MAQNVSLRSSSGLPVCLSGITNPLAFSMEMADHDRRRKVFKKMKILRGREALGIDQEIRSNQRSHERVGGDGDGARDLAGVLHDFSCISVTTYIAKAA